MTPLELDEIRGLVGRRAAAIGPGGEKAWLAGLLAERVPGLLAEIDRLRLLYDDQRKVIAALSRPSTKEQAS